MTGRRRARGHRARRNRRGAEGAAAATSAIFTFSRLTTRPAESWSITLAEGIVPGAAKRFGRAVRLNGRPPSAGPTYFHEIGVLVAFEAHKGDVDFLLACRHGLTDEEKKTLYVELEMLLGRSVYRIGTPRARLVPPRRHRQRMGRMIGRCRFARTTRRPRCSWPVLRVAWLHSSSVPLPARSRGDSGLAPRHPVPFGCRASAFTVSRREPSEKAARHVEEHRARRAGRTSEQLTQGEGS